jgi:hypothetical protein
MRQITELCHPEYREAAREVVFDLAAELADLGLVPDFKAAEATR